jgi:hypothetical protein
MGARYYEPNSGRFLSADPLGHDASMDLYSYCNGDPVNNLDPDGRLAAKGAAAFESASDNAAAGEDAIWNGQTTPEMWRQAGISGFENGLTFDVGFVSGGSSNLVTIPGRIALGGLTAGGTGTVLAGINDFSSGQPITTDSLYSGGVSSMYLGAAGATANEGIRAAVWGGLNPFTRGNVLEDQYVGSYGDYSQGLPAGFKTIDNYTQATDTITSIKSIDLSAATYQNPSALQSKITGYASDLGGYTTYTSQGVTVTATASTSRQLVLVIPKGASAAQQAAINSAAAKAQASGVSVIVNQF